MYSVNLPMYFDQFPPLESQAGETTLSDWQGHVMAETQFWIHTVDTSSFSTRVQFDKYAQLIVYWVSTQYTVAIWPIYHRWNSCLSMSGLLLAYFTETFFTLPEQIEYLREAVFKYVF